jgi:hypothetical protein
MFTNLKTTLQPSWSKTFNFLKCWFSVSTENQLIIYIQTLSHYLLFEEEDGGGIEKWYQGTLIANRSLSSPRLRLWKRSSNSMSRQRCWKLFDQKNSFGCLVQKNYNRDKKYNKIAKSSFHNYASRLLSKLNLVQTITIHCNI